MPKKREGYTSAQLFGSCDGEASFTVSSRVVAERATRLLLQLGGHFVFTRPPEISGHGHRLRVQLWFKYRVHGAWPADVRRKIWYKLRDHDVPNEGLEVNAPHKSIPEECPDPRCVSCMLGRLRRQRGENIGSYVYMLEDD